MTLCSWGDGVPALCSGFSLLCGNVSVCQAAVHSADILGWVLSWCHSRSGHRDSSEPSNSLSRTWHCLARYASLWVSALSPLWPLARLIMDYEPFTRVGRDVLQWPCGSPTGSQFMWLHILTLGSALWFLPLPHGSKSKLWGSAIKLPSLHNYTDSPVFLWCGLLPPWLVWELPERQPAFGPLTGSRARPLLCPQHCPQASLGAFLHPPVSKAPEWDQSISPHLPCLLSCLFFFFLPYFMHSKKRSPPPS